MLESKVLVVTGGTGSFGNAVVERFLRTGVAEIRIFSRDEKKQEDMRLAIRDERLRFHIGDVRDYRSVSDVMMGANCVFHAAALKQVPSCEFHPMEALRTNVLGAENVMRAAMEHGVERCVVLSTDKAVYPINAMGMSKALMEKVMVAMSRLAASSGTVLSATRYGNVMASRGSVIPIFVDQLLRDQPITITDPSMTRFLMSLDESVELVSYAFANARSGDIYVQKAPASTIADLATALSELLGRDSANQRFIGTRHGEKLYESLISREEMARAEDHGNYYRIPADTRDLNYDKYFVEGEARISEMDDYTSHNTRRLNVEEVKHVLSSLSLVQDAMERATSQRNRAR